MAGDDCAFCRRSSQRTTTTTLVRLVLGVLLLGASLWAGLPATVGRGFAQLLLSSSTPCTGTTAAAAADSDAWDGSSGRNSSSGSKSSAADWAFLGPQSGCAIAHDGTVVPRAAAAAVRCSSERWESKLPFLLDAAAMPDPNVSCAHCTALHPTLSTPDGSGPCCGVCMFGNAGLERSLCSKYHPDGPSRAEFLARLPPKQQAALRTLSPCELWARLQGRTLFLVGDSLTLQLYNAIECFLREFAPSLRRSNLTDDPALIDALSEGTSRGRDYPRCLALAKDTQVCGVRQYSTYRMQSKALPALRTLRGSRLKSDIMVHNFGLHLNRTSTGPYRKNLTSLAEYLHANANWLPTMVWLDTSPQHFDTPDGTWLGRGLQPKGCAPFLNRTLFQATAVGHNQLAAGLEVQLGAAHLQSWALSAGMWDQHLEDDCTHWCHPGVVEVWLVLLNQLLAEQGLGNTVNVTAGRRTQRPPKQSYRACTHLLCTDF